MQFQVGWVEIPVTDIERARRFYSALFEVEAEIVDDGTRRTVTLTSGDQSGVGASLTQVANFEPGDKGPLVYVSPANDDMDAALSQVEAAGGSIVEGKTPMGSAGFYGLFKDTEGNTLAFYSSK